VHAPNARNYLVLANIVAKKILPRSVILELVKDGRAADDIDPTYYRANDAHALHTLGESVNLQSESVRFLTQPQPTAVSSRQRRFSNSFSCLPLRRAPWTVLARP
jgi:hypothetical protein